MIAFLKTVCIAVLAGAGSALLIFHYAPLSWVQNGSAEPLLGTAVTTIQGSDTLSNSRTTINTNFANLNSGKIEVGSTSIAAVTTLGGLTSASLLATIGTITSGIWNGTAITPTYGGTGSTTLSINQVLLGNTTGNIKTVSGYGTSGQVLTSAGSALAPTWSTLNVNSNNGLTYTITGARQASSTVLMEDGSGNLSFNVSKISVIENTSNNTRLSTNAGSTTLTTVTIPANTLSSTASIDGRALFSMNGANTCNFDIRYGDGSATSSLYFVKLAGLNYTGNANFSIYATSTTAQSTYAVGDSGGANPAGTPTGTAGQATFFASFATVSAYNLANKTYLSVSSAIPAGGGTCYLSGLTVRTTNL